MKERDFLNWVMEVAKRTGWRCWHVPAPMVASRKGGFVGSKQGAGLPDLILIHDDPPSLIFAELKGDDGDLTPEQREFLQLARKVSEYTGERPHRRIGTYVWKPGLEEFIETVLKSRVLA